MANRYWVGGSGNWSSTSHWSTSSGGSSGASVPSTSDDVFIDSNSGFGSGGTITLDEQAFANDLICTSGHTYTLNHDSTFGFSIYGSLTLENGITNNNKIRFYSTSTDETITTDGVTINGVYFLGAGGKWTLQDDLVIVGEFYQQNGTVDANDHNISAYDFYFYADVGFSPSIIMGSGIWEITGDGSYLWYIDSYNSKTLSVTPETSTIKITGSGGSGDKVFRGSGLTYNNIWLAATESDNNFSFIIYGSNTFNIFKVDNIATSIKVKFYFGTTQTINSFIANGKDGDLITLTSTGGEFTLSQASGVVECNYLDISNSNATGGAAWYAGADSVDTTNNTGWIFSSLANDSRSSVSFGGDGRYVEDFSTTTKKDAGNTTASWTGDGTAEMT